MSDLKLADPVNQQFYKVDFLDSDALITLEVSSDDLISRYFAADESSIEQIAEAYADAKLDGASVYSYGVTDTLLAPSNAPCPLEYWSVTAAVISPVSGILGNLTYAYALSEEQAWEVAHALQQELSDGTDTVAVWVRYDEVF